MKKLVLSIAAIVAFSLTSDAQTRKGTILLGAGSDLSDQTINDITITPKVGYFVQDGVAIGAILNFSNNKETVKDNASNSIPSRELDMTKSTIGGFARYYASNNVFAELGVSVNSTSDEKYAYLTESRPVMNGNLPVLNPDGTQKYDVTNEKETIALSSRSTDINFGLGYTLVLKDHFALEPYVRLSFVNGSEKFYNEELSTDPAEAAVPTNTANVFTVGDQDISGTKFNLGLNFSMFF